MGVMGLDIVQLIGQVGFPIVVTTWLLLKLEDKLEAAEKAAITLAAKLETHTERCNQCREGKGCRDCIHKDEGKD